MSDTISISSQATIMAPEIPRRSNSIISMTSHNNIDMKPLLSPRVHPSGLSQAGYKVAQQQATVSPKMLDSLNEEASHHAADQPPAISPRTDIRVAQHKPSPHLRNTR